MKLPKILFKEEKYKNLSLHAKVLYAFLLDRKSLSEKNGWRDEKGETFVIFTRKEACEVLGVAHAKCIQVFKELVDCNLIFEKRQHIGKSNVLYIKNIPVGYENHTCQVSKSYPNKTDYNNTDFNNTENQSVKSDWAEDVTESVLLEKIKDACELEIWNEPTFSLLDSVIDEIFYSEELFVGNRRYTKAKLQSKLTELSAEAIIFAVDNMKTKGGEIKSPKAYLRAALINAIDDYKAEALISS